MSEFTANNGALSKMVVAQAASTATISETAASLGERRQGVSAKSYRLTTAALIKGSINRTPDSAPERTQRDSQDGRLTPLNLEKDDGLSSCSKESAISSNLPSGRNGEDGHDSIPQDEAKKRKRRNRTKTGCLTCRKRKTKCDEGKPECSNCTKGKFSCVYPQQRSTRGSKVDGAHGGMSFREIRPWGSLSAADLCEKKFLTTHCTGANGLTTRNAQAPPPGEEMNKDCQRLPPISELGQTGPDPSMHSNHSYHSASHSLVHSSHSLQHSQVLTKKGEERNFYQFDPKMCPGRQRCATACWKFNTLTAHGVSPEERARLFREILQPCLREWCVGRDVTVETPFTCDYGYNIIIGNDVAIGRNCTINDVCEVKIGNNCVIGPNVSIYTSSLPLDPRERQSGHGRQSGRAITIGPDCWIGGSAIILPGRTIGMGSTVEVGSIVTKDVPPFTVVSGNPARLLQTLPRNCGPPWPGRGTKAGEDIYSVTCFDP